MTGAQQLHTPEPVRLRRAHSTLSFEPTLTVEEAIVHAITVETDECDACPADAHVKAYVYALMPSGRSISYCSHHGTAYFPELARQAETLIDLRYTLTE